MAALVGPPLVGIVCDREIAADGMQSHRAGHEYVTAILGIGALPLLIPVTEPPLEIGALLARLDGLLFTGAPSNVSPKLYDGTPPRPGTSLDGARDTTSLALLKAAIDVGLPTLCICRGFQELNVALGGTLDQHVHETPGRLDHREKPETPPDVQYGLAHVVRIADGGTLAGLLGTAEVMVNSLHHQGIARLAPGLFAEAHASDGLIEAVSLPGAKGFLLGVQWHPEWAAAGDPVSRAIFARFRQALAR
jgi:putative glutamine amidotransferase